MAYFHFIPRRTILDDLKGVYDTEITSKWFRIKGEWKRLSFLVIKTHSQRNYTIQLEDISVYA